VSAIVPPSAKKEECARESPRTGIRESHAGRGRMKFFREIRGGVVAIPCIALAC